MSNQIFIPKKYPDSALEFFNLYHLQKEIVCPEKKINSLKLKKDRICRFCNSGKASFKNKPHIISELLGNKYLISDFECDDCNSIFSEYESHLSQFLGHIRAFQKIKNPQDNKKYKSPSNRTIIESYDSFGLKNAFSISREDVQDETFLFNPDMGEVTLILAKNGYSPLKVYKAVLKIALSCLPEEELSNYKWAFKYIISDSVDNQFGSFPNILITTTPPGTGFTSPNGILFKKKDETLNFFTHVFRLSFLNQVYQIFIPLNQNDFKFYESERVNFLFCPPMFSDAKTADSINITEKYLNMSSPDIIKGEQEQIAFTYDPSLNINLSSDNGSIDKAVDGKLNFDNIKKIILMPQHARFILPITN